MHYLLCHFNSMNDETIETLDFTIFLTISLFTTDNVLKKYDRCKVEYFFIKK